MLLRDENDSFRLIEDAIKTLQSCKNVSHYILSNTNPDIYNNFVGSKVTQLVPHGNQFFSTFQDCRKPAPLSYLKLIEHTGGYACDIIFVDDKEENIKAAEKMGIKGILYNGLKDNISVLINGLLAQGIFL